MSRKERKRTTYNLQIEKIDQLTKECERLTAEKNAMGNDLDFFNLIAKFLCEPSWDLNKENGGRAEEPK